jgi:hypothetical protein
LYGEVGEAIKLFKVNVVPPGPFNITLDGIIKSTLIEPNQFVILVALILKPIALTFRLSAAITPEEKVLVEDGDSITLPDPLDPETIIFPNDII